jgi:hypothetical protein
MQRDKLIQSLEDDAVPTDDDQSISKYLDELSNSAPVKAPTSAADSEAIQTAVAKIKEKKTKTGKVAGAGKHKPTPYKRATPQMHIFAGHILRGMTPSDAYRNSYDCRNKTEAQISRDANRTLKLEAVQRLLQAGSELATEMLVNDVVAARRFVMQQLIDHALLGKAENTKLKALELMGRAIGMYTDKIEQKVEEVNVDKLKTELKTHLAMLDVAGNVKPIRKRSA